jgi:periplasmic protein TonB
MKWLCFGGLWLVALISNAQQTRNAEYIGGMAKFYAFLARDLKYPPTLSRGDYTGKIMVRFRVTQQGKIDSVSLLKGPGKDWEAMFAQTLHKTSGQWRPAKSGGKPVASIFIIPISCIYPE